MGSNTAIAILVSGLPGTGKTFFAKQLAPALEATYYSTDIMRKNLTPERTYTYAEKSSVYHELLERFEQSLRSAQTVVMDATFYKQDLRAQFAQAARRAQARVVWIELRADEAVVRERLARPRADSDADYSVYLKLKGEYEPIMEPHLVLWSDREGVEEMIGRVREWIGHE